MALYRCSPCTVLTPYTSWTATSHAAIFFFSRCHDTISTEERNRGSPTVKYLSVAQRRLLSETTRPNLAPDGRKFRGRALVPDNYSPKSSDGTGPLDHMAVSHVKATLEVILRSGSKPMAAHAPRIRLEECGAEVSANCATCATTGPQNGLRLWPNVACGKRAVTASSRAESIVLPGAGRARGL